MEPTRGREPGLALRRTRDVAADQPQEPALLPLRTLSRSAVLTAAAATWLAVGVAGAPASAASVDVGPSATGQAARCSAAASSAVIAATPWCASTVCAWNPVDAVCKPG
jgi:hypothetical protein